MATAITNARIFDGERLLPSTALVVSDGRISYIGSSIPSDISIDQHVDATDMTLLPGLIDSHTHVIKLDNLRLALKFGVTTELEMMGHWTADERAHIAASDDLADMFTADFGVTPPDGHPSELLERLPKANGVPAENPQANGHAAEPEPHAKQTNGHAKLPNGDTHTPTTRPNAMPDGSVAPTATTPAEATAFVADRVAAGADYIKLMIEDGTTCGAAHLPTLSPAASVAAVAAAHAHSKLAIAHTLSVDATRQALAAGVDGLAHLFIDQPDARIVHELAASGAFVTPCLCLNSSLLGQPAHGLAADPRVAARLDAPTLAALRSAFATYPRGNMGLVLATARALHEAGVDVCAGTDSALAIPALGGVVHGASLHHELQLLVRAGWTPGEALAAATAVPARRFGLSDRGRLEVGRRADLLLVAGDPTADIGDTLNLRGVWRRGVRLVE